MPRRLHTWKIRSRDLALGDRTLVMGVLNVTPDSFSDGGNYLDPDRAYARALQMEEQGADIIDIGAESTRPGAQAVTAAEELQRLVPVLKRLRDRLSIPISVDTYKAEVAERALELGVDIINDPSGFTFDPLLAKPVVQYNAGVIFNHMRGRPETWASLGPMQDVMGSITKDLDASVNRARRAGVDRARIVVDPGIGFGKRREQNSEILARLGEMARLELPILVGPSRKSFLAQATERETEFGTAAAITAGILNGAHIVRVHDVAEMKAVVSVADEIWRVVQKIAEGRELAEAETPRRKRMAGPTPQIQATAARPAVRPPLAIAASAAAPEPVAPPVQEGESSKDAPQVLRPAEHEKPRREGSARPEGDRPFKPRFEGTRPFKPRQDGPPRSDGARPSKPRQDGPPRSDGSRPFKPRQDGPPRSDGARPFKPRQDGPPRSDGSRPFKPRQDGPPRSDGSRPFKPRQDGPPRSDGARPFKPRQDGSRPFKPRWEGPPKSGGASRGSKPPGSRPPGPRKGGGPPRESRPKPRRGK